MLLYNMPVCILLLELYPVNSIKLFDLMGGGGGVKTSFI